MELLANPGVTHILYHANCFDGFTAAWVGRLAEVPEENLIPINHGGAVPEVPEDASVLMVDFSLPRPGLEELKGKVRDLIVLDHHVTARDALDDLEWAHFDMEESGASLAWDFFFPEDSRPKLVRYAREHDLWRFELPNSAAVRSYIRSYDMSFENWDELNTTLEMDMEVVVREGMAIQRAQEAAVAMMCKNAITMKVGGHDVPVVNATVFFSEVATRLLKMHPEAPFAAYYMDRADGVRQWGMRSRTDFDCSEVAKRYGGGGHPQAAGFSTAIPEILIKKD